MKKKFLFSIIFLGLTALFCSGQDYTSVSAGGWYGWGTSLDDYFLSGSAEPLDLEGQCSGGNARLEAALPRGWYTLGLWLDYTGSYLLTGGEFDVLRRVDLSIGGTARVSAFRYAQPYVSLGLLYADYLLFVPHHPSNSPVLYLWGLRFAGGILSEIFSLDFQSFELAFQAGPEYVLEMLFSDTAIFLHEIRGRVGLEMRFR
ncbi:MAG: hypothetical protein JW760_11840 [Spirochaetales bacterium]|nr:hypothetical protein [Spirochaetales bacterium]